MVIYKCLCIILDYTGAACNGAGLLFIIPTQV